MKTIISATGNTLKSTLDLRFGRSAWFCLLDEGSGETTFYPNEFRDAEQGAGGKVVEKVVGQGVGKVISGDFGPKARDLLEKFNIQMVIIDDETLTIQDIIDKIK